VNQLLSKSLFRRVIGSKVVTELVPPEDYFIAEKVVSLSIYSWVYNFVIVSGGSHS
jgi:hypothetical protein